MQCLEGYLHCFDHSCPTKWKDWLALAEYWYNISYHSSLQLTPFEVLYGQKPRHLGIDVVEACAVPDLQEWLTQRKPMTQLLQQQLIRVQQRQKHQADKQRSERNFEVGESVFLKIQPYIQSSLQKKGPIINYPSNILGLTKYYKRLEQWHTNWSCPQPPQFTLFFMCHC